jgi:arsenate reductase
VLILMLGPDPTFIPGKRYIDWELPDPSGEPIATVRAIRGDIAERVKRLGQELSSN